MKHALVRPISHDFHRAIVRVPADRPPDVERARVQHAAYVRALESLRLTVHTLPLSDSPDGCFVEDQAVVVGDTALITRSGHPGRRGEANDVSRAFSSTHRVVRMEAPATLDGGDVLRLGATLYVGVSERTGAAGVASLADTFRPQGLSVVEVAVEDALHLKCFATALGGQKVLVAPSKVNPACFVGADVVEVAAEEAYAANVVAVGDHVLVAAGYPRVAAALDAKGFSLTRLHVDEMARADGSLTCLSVLW